MRRNQRAIPVSTARALSVPPMNPSKADRSASFCQRHLCVCLRSCSYVASSRQTTDMPDRCRRRPSQSDSFLQAPLFDSARRQRRLLSSFEPSVSTLIQRKRGSFQIWIGHLHLSSCRLRIPLFYCIREHSLRNPEDTFYKRLAAECRRVQIFIDAFSFCGRYADLASVVFLPRYSGGQANSHISIDTRRDTMSLLAALSISRLHHEARRRQTAS